jgi:hypothetical protein
MTVRIVHRGWGIPGLLLCLSLLPRASARGQVLFDATKAQMAANADWVIDADTRNIGTNSTTGAMQTGLGNESNPQRVPTPAASGITALTAETYWSGALSSWGVGLVKRGQAVETLPFNGTITYGNAGNAQDLSKYKAYVVVEPNIAYTAAEKTAIVNYVKNGGSLFMVADHGSSDRNGDGVDAVDVLNDLMANNTVKANPFGLSFNGDSVSPSTPSIDSALTNPITRGPAGTVTDFAYASGSTISITAGGPAMAAVWASSARSSSAVMVAYGTYGLGRFVAVGDSSPFDDGTGDPNDTLFDGWNDANGSDGFLALNGTVWLTAVPEPTSLAVMAAPAALLLASRRRRSRGKPKG